MEIEIQTGILIIMLLLFINFMVENIVELCIWFNVYVELWSILIKPTSIPFLGLPMHRLQPVFFSIIRPVLIAETR